ncbi:hypothetical protein ACLB2K_052491 [Fragaria x ananassa]
MPLQVRLMPQEKNATSSQADVPQEKNAATSEATVSTAKKVRYSRKAKSGFVKKKAKLKKKREKATEVEDPNITGGLRLLSRPMDHCFEMQSYIGVLARTTIPIIYDHWRNVDDERKQKIWEAIEEAYVIPKECRKHDTPEKLENPPGDYRCIPKLHWALFVEDRISDEFKELREVQSGKKIKMNKYNHCMSRKGYAQSRVELAKKLATMVGGVGGFVRPNVVFDLPPKRKSGGSSQLARKSIRLIMKEEHEDFMAEQKAKWEEENKRRVLKEREFWTSKFEILAAQLKGTGVQIPLPVTPVNELNSGHGSCYDPTHEKLNPVKKSLDLASKLSSNILDLTCGDDECQLTIDSIDNIVAMGKLICVDVDSSNHLIHGMPLGENNVRVTVVRAIVGDSLVPNPMRDEILTVDDAVGSCVAWPKELVVTPGAKAPIAAAGMKKPKRSYSRKKSITPFDDNQDLEHLPPNLPHELNELCKWANTSLKRRRTLYIVFFSNLFCHAKKASIYRSDVYAIVNMEEVSNGVILFYMSYLQGVLKKNKMEDMIQFVDCDQVSAIGSGTPTTRSRDLFEMYKKGKPWHIFLIPYNTGDHWTLTIVNPEKENARYMDPLKKSLNGSEWPSIVTGSLKMYKGLKKNNGKKQANPWKPLLGALIQRDVTSYGYYVMRYMKYIVEDDNLDPDEKWGTRAGTRDAQTYTTQQLDEVREE